MTGVIQTNPKVQFLAADGSPLVGGKLFTYLAGTSTLTTTWQDLNQTTANTNPIILDARGEAVIWLDPDLSYKFVLQTATGVSVWTVDNITGATPATFIAILAGSGGSALIGFIQAGAGAVLRTAQSKMRDFVSVKDFGAVGDGVTDDSAAIQLAINAAAAFSSVLVQTTVSGYESVGGGCVYFPQTPNGYLINTALKIPAKIRLEGPAKLIGAAGVNIFTLTYTGSTTHSMVVIENLDFVAGAIGINVGDQAAAFPVVVTNCKFINQTSAGIKFGAFAYNLTFRDNLFTGCKYGIWNTGSASDVALIDHNVFIYNSDYDIYVQSTNTLRITNNDFVGNLKTPASSVANIYFDTGANSEVGGYTVIANNKFGQEGRTAGKCIYFAGSSNQVQGVVIENNLLHFDSSAVNAYAIGFDAKQPNGFIIQNNNLLFCALVDYSTVPLGGFVKNNSFANNVCLGVIKPSTITTNAVFSDAIEPPTIEKYNRIQWSRLINNPFFIFANQTPSYMTATDENGIANNATTALATASNNFVRFGGVIFDPKYKTYAMSIWMKLSTAGNVLFNVARGGNTMCYQTVAVGTAWQRVTFDITQTVEVNPLNIEITISNGVTATFGGVCVVAGRDVGDLIRSDRMIEYYGSGIQSIATPTTENAVYVPAGTRVWTSAPTVGQPTGWMCTTAGNPGTWSALANL